MSHLFLLGRCLLELAQELSCVAPVLHFSGCSSPLGVTNISIIKAMAMCVARVVLDHSGNLGRHTTRIQHVSSTSQTMKAFAFFLYGRGNAKSDA